MTNVLQVCGVTIPSVADAWVYREVTSVALTDPTGVYIETEIRWPAATQAAWDADNYTPAFMGVGSQGNPYNEAYIDWNFLGDTPWKYDGTALDGLGTDYTPDVWHTLRVHYHDLTVDASIDAEPLQTDATTPPYSAFTGFSFTVPWGTTTVQKLASPFTIDHTTNPSGAGTSILNAVSLFDLGISAGSPSDNIIVQVCADAGGAPGTVLDTVSQPLSAGRLFFFTGAVTLTEGTQYWVVISRAGAPDNSNYYYTDGDSAGSFYNGTTWAAGGGLACEIFTQFLGIQWGAFFTDPVMNALLIRQINVGTGGFGSGDIFSEDWSGGSPLSDFDAHSGDLVIVPEPGVAPFSLSRSPVALALGTPDSGHTSIISTMLSGSPEPITLSVVTTLPTGVTAVFLPSTITDDGGVSTLTISVDNTASPGHTVLLIKGDDGAGGTDTTTVDLYISTPQPGFHVAS